MENFDIHFLINKLDDFNCNIKTNVLNNINLINLNNIGNLKNNKPENNNDPNVFIKCYFINDIDSLYNNINSLAFRIGHINTYAKIYLKDILKIQTNVDEQISSMYINLCLEYPEIFKILKYNTEYKCTLHISKFNFKTIDFNNSESLHDFINTNNYISNNIICSYTHNINFKLKYKHEKVKKFSNINK